MGQDFKHLLAIVQHYACTEVFHEKRAHEHSLTLN